MIFLSSLQTMKINSSEKETKKVPMSFIISGRSRNRKMKNEQKLIVRRLTRRYIMKKSKKERKKKREFVPAETDGLFILTKSFSYLMGNADLIIWRMRKNSRCNNDSIKNVPHVKCGRRSRTSCKEKTTENNRMIEPSSVQKNHITRPTDCWKNRIRPTQRPLTPDCKTETCRRAPYARKRVSQNWRMQTNHSDRLYYIFK